MTRYLFNAGPLIALAALDRFDLLGSLDGAACTTQQVAAEFRAKDSPLRLPADLEVLDVPAAGSEAALSMSRLDAGETSVLTAALCLEGRSVVVIDDLKARKVARRMGLLLVGTAGLLLRAHDRGLIDVSEAFVKLRAAGYRLSDRLVAGVLARTSAHRRA
ncbi:MAG: DUF3368 domain-containing protein [Deltaproteobacteria bacterium]|nr:DUF3368 domain-containing protein [Deltaproteobacteria bacterium]